MTVFVSSETEAMTPSFLARSRVPQGPTDELLTWLSKVNKKKYFIRETHRRDLLKEALLESSRRTAQTALEAKQRERMQRWRRVMQTFPPSREESPCYCDACLSCLRHGPQLHGKCYCCNVILISPRPAYMELHRAVSGQDRVDEDSVKIDEFLASLSSPTSGKRKLARAAEEEEQPGIDRKRAKA